MQEDKKVEVVAKRGCKSMFITAAVITLCVALAVGMIALAAFVV